jgi:DNA mismatch repair ATPase MutS
MAQTIATCLADAYAAPRFVVRSVIGRADDLLSGKSYYAVEVEAVLALVRAGKTDVPHLFLFDEMFRGTNAVERIAAGEAVLASLVAAPQAAPRPHVAIAATHDRELVDLLQARYASCHFTDSVGPNGLVFDFKIHPGPATSRNAIALLKLAGAPDDLVEQALNRAAELDSLRRSAP